MNYNTQIAKHFRDVHFGGNWTVSNLKEHVADVTWEEAVTKIHSFNSIAVLVFHINYFVVAAANVLEGHPLDAHDKFSFDVPPIQSESDWQKLLDKTWRDAERFTALIEQLPDDKLGADFTDKKYGNYFRNLHGIIEHTHYHLGQIVILKKLIRSGIVS